MPYIFLKKRTIYLVLLFSALISATKAQQEIGGFNAYFGSLHNHTNVSDDAVETPLDAYIYAKEVAGMDFLGLSDHAHSTSTREWNDTQNNANQITENGKFVAFRGFEWSHSNYGHVTVVNSSEITTRDTTRKFSDLVRWLESNDAIAFLNHPGRQNGGGNEFHNFNSIRSESIVGMELWNQSQGYENYYYTNGYFSNDGGLSYFEEAQIKGWKIGASGSGDNHGATWGTRNDNRMAILATELTRDALYQAMKIRRFYSTMDKNLGLSFKIDGQQMGSVIKNGTHNVVIEANDGNEEIFTNVKLFKNGLLLNSWNPNAKSPVLTYDNLISKSGDFFHVKVTQQDGEEAISSPIYILSNTAGLGTTKSTSSRISQGTNDVEEDKNGKVRLTSPDIDLVYDGANRGDQTIGLRFSNLNIPQGATISKAYLQFTAMGRSTTYSLMNIQGEDVDNSAPFSNLNKNVSERNKTNANVQWGPFRTTWNEGESGSNQRTSDIKSVIQEIVNRTSYSSNNAISLIINGIGEKRAYAYEGDSTKAPLLFVEYVSSSTNKAPQVAITNLTNNQFFTSGSTIIIAASATDTDGTISKVEFYNGGTKLGEDTSAPYSYNWNPTVNGSNNIVAKATDNNGNTTTSLSVNITIQNNTDELFGVASRISQGNDDAEENLTENSVSTTSLDLDLSYNEGSRAKQLIGLRFQNLHIPKGATIENAYIQFWVNQTGSPSGKCDLKISGEDSDNSLAFSNNKNNLSERSKTTSQINWNVASWDKGSNGGVRQQTPNLKSIIQEIINRNNYTESSAISLLFEGIGNGSRTAASYEAYQQEKREGQPPKLFITYSGATSPVIPYPIRTTQSTIHHNGCATIIYDSSKGNKKLINSSGDIYAHTGVITNNSTSLSDWKYAPTWLDNSPKYKLTNLGNNKHQLIIDNIRDYYGVSESDIINKLTFVFRNENGSIVGKDLFDEDLFVDVSSENSGDCNTVSIIKSKTKEPNIDLIISPNPTTGSITIYNYNNDNKESITVSLYDTFGRLVSTKAHTMGKPLNLSSLTEGIYFLQIVTENNTIYESKKIVVYK